MASNADVRDYIATDRTRQADRVEIFRVRDLTVHKPTSTTDCPDR